MSWTNENAGYLHLTVHRTLRLTTVRQLPSLEGLDLAQPEVLTVHTVVPDVDELAELPPALVTLEPDQLFVEPALELGTRLVLRCVPVQDLHHEDGEFLVGARAHGDPDPVHHRVVLQLDLSL